MGGAAISAATGANSGPRLDAQIGRENTRQAVAIRPEAREINSGDNATVTTNETVVNETDYWLIGGLIVMSVLFGSLVDDAVRIAWNKWRNNG